MLVSSPFFPAFLMTDEKKNYLRIQTGIISGHTSGAHLSGERLSENDSPDSKFMHPRFILGILG